ncbi:MAG: FAD-dependent oxidoreductase, partial [Acidobacteriota bacterium]|nr:FAD-dependent oxidoreductase [Acidobacteriota bacterium]
AVHRGMRVHTVVGQHERGLQVTVGREPGERERCDVDALVVTLPPVGIRDITWRDATLDEAVTDHVRHHDYGTTYLRVTLVCRHRVWRDLFPEDYFVSDAFGGVTVYDQSPDDGTTGVGIQSWLLGGAPARDLLPLSDDEIVGLVHRAMPSQIPLSEADLLAKRVDRWTGVAGVSALPGGVPLRPLERRHRPDPRWPQLLFIGDYLYDATLCGALDAVRYAVARLTERLEPTNADDTSEASSLFVPIPSIPSTPRAAFFMDR